RSPQRFLGRGEARQTPLEVPLRRDKATQVLEGGADPPLALDVGARVAATAAKADHVATHPQCRATFRAQVVVGAEPGKQRDLQGRIPRRGELTSPGEGVADAHHAVALRRDQSVPERDLEFQLQPAAVVVLEYPV